jgi:hypothetical protein
LGIDPSKVTKSVNKETKTYSVKDLENMIEQSKKPSKIVSQSNSNQSTLTNNSAISPLSIAALSKQVWQTDAYSNYWLTYSCFVYYQNGLFTSASHPTIAITTNAIGLPIGISISIDSISQDSLSFSPSTIIHNTMVTIGHYYWCRSSCLHY